MQYEIIQYQHLSIAQLLPQHPIMHTPQEVLEMLVNFLYQDVKHIVIHDYHLPSTFFDLSSGLAGDVLQKFSNYGGYAAIVGQFKQYPSTSLHQFIQESNRYGRIVFVADKETALQLLANKNPNQ